MRIQGIGGRGYEAVSAICPPPAAHPAKLPAVKTELALDPEKPTLAVGNVIKNNDIQYCPFFRQCRVVGG